MPHRMFKKLRNCMVCSAGCPLLKDEGFSCGLDILYRDVRISKLQFLIKIIFADVFFQFYHSSPGSAST